jgi:hypothetical protein
MEIEYARDEFGEISIVLNKYVRGAFGEICIQLGDFYTREFTGECWKREVKISKNIIDLIEVGDFVNGFPVVEPVYNGNVWFGVDEGYEQFKRAFGDIKTILTHEQFEQNAYRLEEK